MRAGQPILLLVLGIIGIVFALDVNSLRTMLHGEELPVDGAQDSFPDTAALVERELLADGSDRELKKTRRWRNLVSVPLNPALAPVSASIALAPATYPTMGQLDDDAAITTFCVVADAPYDTEQETRLLQQVETMDDDCEFMVHLGDIRSASNFDTCLAQTYSNVGYIMSQCPKPVFMMIGDNEWNDCPNHEEALQLWHDEFDEFYNKHWTHGFNVTSQSARIENIQFIHKQTLFIGLNIVGGRRHDKTEWNLRLTSNFYWTSDLIRTHVLNEKVANAVVIMAHATNSDTKMEFFGGMRDFIASELNNDIPILYLNGDTHVWNYEPDFYDQSSWLRITLQGLTSQPPLKVTVNATSGVSTIEEAFSYDRSL